MQFAPQRFRGHTAIVTGAASGIGFAVANRLLKEGAAVSIWDLRSDDLRDAQRKLGAHHMAAFDIRDPVEVISATKASVDALGGKLDILIASAGITGPNVLVKDYPAEDWKRVVDVNLHGSFYCNKAAVAEMERNGYGRIVNVASIAAKEGNPFASAYSASKAGLIALTKSLGKETALSGITVNCIAPAAIRTPLFDQMTAEHIKFMLSKIPMQRFGEVPEAAALICWLASEECSFCTGAVFDLSGGRATY